MKKEMGYEHQDWETVTISKHSGKAKVTDANAAAKAKRAGADVETVKKSEKDKKYAVLLEDLSLPLSYSPNRQCEGQRPLEGCQKVRRRGRELQW